MGCLWRRNKKEDSWQTCVWFEWLHHTKSRHQWSIVKTEIPQFNLAVQPLSAFTKNLQEFAAHLRKKHVKFGNTKDVDQFHHFMINEGEEHTFGKVPMNSQKFDMSAFKNKREYFDQFKECVIGIFEGNQDQDEPIR